MYGNVVLIYDKRIEISHKYKKVLEHSHSAQVYISASKNDFFENLIAYEPDMILISESIAENLSDLCKEIREKNLQFRPVIILLSKSSYSEDRTNALNSGADDFLSEPISADEFSARINAHLRRTLEENSFVLTKLPDSSYCRKIMRQTLHKQIGWAMMLIGIDNFVFYREIYGDIAADKLLQAMSAILKASCEYDDIIGQLHSDNFLIITSSYKAEKLADYINFAFDSIVKKFYSDEDAENEYILLCGANKSGCKIPLMTISTGIINSEIMQYRNETEIINALNNVQKLAKTISGSSKIVDIPLITSEVEKLFEEKTVIVIERDEDLAYLLETTLKIQGFSPIVINCYDIDIFEILSYAPSLIIVDSAGDEYCSGIELCKKIRENTNQNIKIICTDTSHEKESVFSAGADLYLPKPYDLMELFQWIYKLLD